MKSRPDIYQAVTDRIVAALEAGDIAPWKRPWKLSGGYPISLRSGKPYRGVNVLLLMLSGFDDPRWGTYKAIAEAGGQVRKGEQSTQIVFWKRVKKKDEEEGSYYFLRYFNVFNVRQADGIPDLPVEEEREFTPIEAAEQIAGGYVWTSGSMNGGPTVETGFDRACYSLTKDSISMPTPQQFISDEAYYTTLFHELIHSTGAAHRLKRIEPALFGSDPYAKEELVAEIGASFLSGHAGFERAGGDESAAYIGGWMKRIKDEPKLVVQAAAQAQKAADLILGTQFDDDESARADSTLVAA